MQMSYLYASDLPFKNFIYFRYFTSFGSCYCKKHIDISFLCVCPPIEDECRHNIVKVCCGTRATLTMILRNSSSIINQSTSHQSTHVIFLLAFLLISYFKEALLCLCFCCYLSGEHWPCSTTRKGPRGKTKSCRTSGRWYIRKSTARNKFADSHYPSLLPLIFHLLSPSVGSQLCCSKWRTTRYIFKAGWRKELLEIKNWNE